MTRSAVLDLLPYCVTENQREVIHAVSTHGVTGAGMHLGKGRRGVQRILEKLRQQQVLRADAPASGMTSPLPAPLQVERMTQTILPDGSFGTVWVKSKISQENQIRLMQETVEAFKESLPKTKPLLRKQLGTLQSSLLCNLHVITDFHIGMLAWPEETRSDPWDTDIASTLLYQWFEQAIVLAPEADTAVLANLGDFLHFDGLAAVTPESGHLLDADGRFQRIVRITIRLFRRIISLLLSKYETVYVIMGEGNHDRDSSPWLREMFAEFYDNEPRLLVDKSPDPFYCVEFGETALFFHHGHLSKMESVDRAFAGKFRDVFGRTRHAYAHMGHFHHRKELETSLMIVKQHRTLSPLDAYASRHGYMSGREAQVVTYHKTFGEVGSISITPDMLRNLS